MWLEPYLKETPPKVAAWNGEVTQKRGRGRISKSSGSEEPKGGFGCTTLQLNYLEGNIQIASACSAN